jgi:DNA-binding NarL/FixJ family response regulator
MTDSLDGRARPEKEVRVLCVDDNELVADAIARALRERTDMSWLGWLPDVRELRSTVDRLSPDVILLDIDMPHGDSFKALQELTLEVPDTRVIMLSGYVRRELVERALEAGAMGYISKNDAPRVILDGIARVAAGELILGPEAEAAFHQR